MPKVISPTLAAHLLLPTTTLATLWKVKRADGTLIGFTDHDQDIIYNDGTDTVHYYAATGFTPSAQETNSDLAVDNLEVTAFMDVSAISEADLRSGLYDFCVVEIRFVNYMDLTQGDLKLRCGTVGNVKIQNGVGHFEVRGLMYRTTLPIGELFGPACRAELGDARCKIVLSLWTQTGTVSSVTDKATFNPTTNSLKMVGSGTPTANAPAGWFDQGVVIWTSGLNNGYAMDVLTWDGTTIELFEAMQFAVAPGDTFTISSGCDLTTGPGGCGRYSNIDNFRGEPFIPGPDQIVLYPNADGSVPK